MNLTLAENIRTFRKERNLTQERLAEALGVTVGAVYKWESGLSQPELNMIVELADFFDTSVDALLGYKMKDNRLDAILKRLGEYCRTLDPEALSEAEKALAKYPHSFKAVYGCALVYLAFGSGSHDRGQLTRALELLEKARVLLPQNTEPRINEAMICGDISTVLFLLDEREKCVELLKQNNAGGVFSGQIGAYLSVFMNRPEEASPFLSEALFECISLVLNTVGGYVFMFRARKDWDSALAITAWSTELLRGLRKDGGPDFLDKSYAEMLVLRAYVQRMAGMQEEAYETLRQAGNCALLFDSTPNYSLESTRFADHLEQALVFDIFGATARESIATVLNLLDDPALSGQWKEITGNE